MPIQDYRLPTEPVFLRHASAAQPYAADAAWPSDDDLSDLLFEARIRSGDYFVTLVTELDKLAALLEQDGIPESVALQRISSELTYLDKHYKLQSK